MHFSAYPRRRQVLLLIMIMITSLANCTLDITFPKNFTRSRYSLRNQSNPPRETYNATRIIPSTIPQTTVAPPIEHFHNSTDRPDDGVTNRYNASDCGVRIGENHPWIAVLEHTDPTGRSRKKTLSKGVLIDARHILTTVSSVHSSHPFWWISAVRLGDAPTWGPDHRINRSRIVRADIETVFNHRHKDIAIIRLAVPLTRQQRGDVIEPICLPPSNSYNYRELSQHRCERPTSSDRAAAEVVVKRHSSIVSTVAVQLVQPQDCSIMFRRKEANFTDAEFCAWDEPGDTCTGDLGGPLSAQWNGRHYVVGLNSYINVRDNEAYVPSDYPGVYTRVGSHLQWINAVLSQ